MKNINKKNNNGITLIALVITIVVLLILAGVAISMLSGENGILKQVAEAKEETEKSKIIEQIKIDIAQKQVNNYGYINEEDLYSILRKYGTISSDNTILTTDKGNYNLLISDIYSTTIINRWKGKNAVFVGDSITHGTGVESGMRYWEVLKESLNLSSVTGMGIAGSCISTKSDYGTGNTPLINRYTNIPNADLITIFMGTNDYGHETPLGSITDTTDISFYGALNVIVPALIEKYPTSRIVFVTPLHRYGFGTSSILGTPFTYDYLDNGVGANLEDYVKAIKEVCERYSIPIIDLYSISELDPSDSTIKTSYMPDGLHPNNQGHKLIADTIKKSLNLINPVDIEIPENPNTTGSKKVQVGNAYNDVYKNALNRASMAENIYLKAGTNISLKDNSTYKYGVYKQTSSEVVYAEAISGGWITENYIIESDGWYGIAFAKIDNSNFDFEGVDSTNVLDYINYIEEEPENPDTTESIKVQVGNAYNDVYKNALNRASMAENIYLKAGTNISLKDNSTYKYGVYKQTSSEVVYAEAISGGWITENYIIESDGWYGIAFAKIDNSNFDFEGVDLTNATDYINFD